MREKTKIYINRNSLDDAIETLVRRAEGWYSVGGSGECQLYAHFDEDGHVYEFTIHDFAGHNSWIEGDDIILISIKEWFNWDDHEHKGEWLVGELMDDKDTWEKFVLWLKENDYYDDNRDEERNIYYNWDNFEEFDEEKWDEYMESWREVWLDHYIHEYINDVVHSISSDDDPNYEFVLSYEVEEAEIDV